MYPDLKVVVNFIVETELPQLCGIDVGNVRKIKALLGILASSVPFEVDISKLNGIHRNTVIEYLNSLEKKNCCICYMRIYYLSRRSKNRIRFIWIILISCMIWLLIL